MGSVTRYWCAIGTMGIVTPAIRPTSGAAMPAAFTTVSVPIVPRSVSTPVTRPSATAIPVTRVYDRIVAPRFRAPAASARVKPLGSSQPSVGSQAAPSTASVLMSGKRARASSAETSSIGRP